MTREQTIETSLKRLGLRISDGQSASNGAELRFNCPKCSTRGKSRDTKAHLYVHVLPDERLGWFNCFKCEFKGRLGKQDIELLLSPARSRNPVVVVEKKVELPENDFEMSDGMEAYRYLLSRGITDEDIKYYDLRAAKGRIVFPDYTVDGALDYWVSRTYLDKDPKYENCRVSRRAKLYNLGRFLKQGFKSVTIVEGPISAIIAGRDAVATYGKLITKE